MALRVVADHVRSALMLIADGVTPSNEGRGYVLRRILRRSVRDLRLLACGQRGGDAGGLPARAVRDRADTMATYPELTTDAPRILCVTTPRRRRSSPRCDRHGDLRRGGRRDPARGATLSGAKAFQLHDTYGFPIDLTLEMAAEQGLSVDEAGFRR